MQNTQRIDAVVAELKRVASRAALDLALEVGRIVVERFYGGNVHVWRQRGNRCPSLRRLARHPELPFSAAALYRAVAIFEMASRLPDVATWKHVGASHLRTVVPLPAPDQERLLLAAERERWTVVRLGDEVRTLRSCRDERRGRPPTPKLVRSIRRLTRGAPELDAVSARRDLSVLQPDQLDALRHELSGLRRRCEALEQLITDACDSH